MNIDNIEVFLRGLAQGSDDPQVNKMLGEYMVIALKKPIMAEPQFLEKVGTYPENPPSWLNEEKFKQGNVVEFKSELTQGSADSLRHIKDWVAGALNDEDAWTRDVDDKGRPKKLLKIQSIAHAHALADKAMRKKANILRSRFADTASGFEADEEAGHIKTIKTLEDGSRIVQLLTPHALDIESAQLGHCIGNGAYDEQINNQKKYQYYSLRNPLNKAHATLEVSKNGLNQCKGKNNAPPIEKYFTPLQNFIKENQWTLNEEAAQTGLLYQDGDYYDVQNLPENFHYRGGINLQNAKWFKGFPKGFHANGFVHLNGCTSLMHLAEGFHADGGVYLERCTSLTHIATGFHAGRDVYLERCTSLTHIAKGFHAGGNVYLRSCTSLTHLAEGFHAGGNVYLEGCTNLTHVDRGFHAGGNVYLWGTSLTHIAEGFHAGGNVNLNGCTNLTHIAEGFHAGGNVNLIGCTRLTHLPEDFTVGGSIYWNDKEFTSVEEFRQAFELVHPVNTETPAPQNVAMPPPAP